jgi:transposase InsO family protein
MMCRLYGVTRAGYYAWRRRRPSDHARRDAQLLVQIRAIHSAHDGNYGSPRVHGALQRAGEHLGCKRVARLMRAHRLRGKVADIYRSRAGTKAFFTSIPNRQLSVLADAPNRVWVGDVTYLRLGDTWRFLAVIADKHSRRIVGWALRSRRDVGLTLAALRRAAHQRRTVPGLVFHSDRGIEYAAEAYRTGLRELGIMQSMNRPGRMNDNAHMESFFHTMKSELHRKLSVTTDNKLRSVIGRYIDYFNQRRGHTSLAHHSPAQFEALGCKL